MKVQLVMFTCSRYLGLADSLYLIIKPLLKRLIFRPPTAYWGCGLSDNTPHAYVLVCEVNSMDSSSNSAEKKIQVWSIKGFNIPWALFFVIFSSTMCATIINTANISKYELAFSGIIIGGVFIGIADRVRTKDCFVYIWILIGALSLLISATWVCCINNNVCFE